MSIVAVRDPDMIRDVAAAYLARPQTLNFVFDGPPGPEGSRFVEVETPDGRSVNAGEWAERADGFWELRVPFAPFSAKLADSESSRDAKQPSSPLSRGEPEGFKLVPVEPTEAMVQAGARALTDAASPGSRFYPVGHARTAYAAMLSAAPAPPASEPEGWRDIESAPKDGTRVLLWSSTSGGVWWGYWAVHGANWQPTDTGEDGWTSGAVNYSAELVVYIDPTHWRPLPAPPLQEAAG